MPSSNEIIVLGLGPRLPVHGVGCGARGLRPGGIAGSRDIRINAKNDWGVRLGLFSREWPRSSKNTNPTRPR